MWPSQGQGVRKGERARVCVPGARAPRTVPKPGRRHLESVGFNARAAGPGQPRVHVCSQPQLCKLPPAGSAGPRPAPPRQWPLCQSPFQPPVQSHRPAAGPAPNSCRQHLSGLHSLHLEKEVLSLGGTSWGSSTRLPPSPRGPHVPADIPPLQRPWVSQTPQGTLAVPRGSCLSFTGSCGCHLGSPSYGDGVRFVFGG